MRSILQLAALSLALSLPTASPAQDWADEEAYAAWDRFSSALEGKTEDVAALTAALEAWAKQASPEDVQAIVVGDQGQPDAWPPLLVTLLSAGSSASDSAALLLTAREILARFPETREDGRWQAALAMFATRSGDLDAARASALRARELGVLPCGERCDASFLAWLDSGEVPAKPQITAPAVYDPRGLDCGAPESTGEFALSYIEIDPALLVRTAHGPQAEMTWRLARHWHAALRSCPSPDLWTLRTAIDDAHPATVIDQAWREAQALLAGELPRAVRFLGVELPMPAQECDFSADADCRAQPMALSAQSAHLLLQQLRATSRHLGAAGNCPAPPSEEQKAQLEASEKQFEAAIEALGEAPAAAELIAMLQDPRWQPLLRTGLPYPLQLQLLRAALGPSAGTILAATETWAQAAPLEASEAASTQELLARLALRAGRGQAALSYLTRAQAGSPTIERGKAIGLMRAAIAGADLGQHAAPASLQRPWTLGRDNTVLMQASQEASLLTGFGGIGRGEIALGTLGAEAALAIELRAAWPTLLVGIERIGPRVATWLEEIYGSERLAGMRAEAVASIRLDDEPSMAFAGVRYPLPDRLCLVRGCEEPQPVTRERVIEALVKSGVLAPGTE